MRAEVRSIIAEAPGWGAITGTDLMTAATMLALLAALLTLASLLRKRKSP
jgi:hypothetical protein